MTHAQQKQQTLLSFLLSASLPLYVSSQFPFSSFFSQSPLIPFFSFSVFSLLSSFRLLISLFLSHHASFPLASYLFAVFPVFFQSPLFFPHFLQLPSLVAAYLAFLILSFLFSIFITFRLICLFDYFLLLLLLISVSFPYLPLLFNLLKYNNFPAQIDSGYFPKSAGNVMYFTSQINKKKIGKMSR